MKKNIYIIAFTLLSLALLSSCKSDPVYFEGDTNTVTFAAARQNWFMLRGQKLEIELSRGVSEGELRVPVTLKNGATNVKTYALKENEFVFANGQSVAKIEIEYGKVEDYTILERNKVTLSVDKNTASWTFKTIDLTIGRRLTYGEYFEENIDLPVKDHILAELRSGYLNSLATEAKPYKPSKFRVLIAEEDPVLSFIGLYRTGNNISVMFTDEKLEAIAEFPKQTIGIQDSLGNPISVEFVSHSKVGDVHTFKLKFSSKKGDLGTFDEVLDLTKKK